MVAGAVRGVVDHLAPDKRRAYRVVGGRDGDGDTLVRLILLVLSRPSLVLNHSLSPSMSTQTGVTWGEPFAISVAAWPMFTPSNSLRMLSGILAASYTHLEFTGVVHIF